MQVPVPNVDPSAGDEALARSNRQSGFEHFQRVAFKIHFRLRVCQVAAVSRLRILGGKGILGLLRNP